MAKKIIVLQGTLTTKKKITSGDNKGEFEKVSIGPGDPVGSLLTKKEKDELIEQGVLGYADERITGSADLSELEGELAAQTQRADDATKAAEDAKAAQKIAEDLATKAGVDLEAANKAVDEAETAQKAAEGLAAKAGKDLEGATSSLGAAQKEIAGLKKDLAAANKKLAAQPAK